jgi:hypothetical protein
MKYFFTIILFSVSVKLSAQFPIATDEIIIDEKIKIHKYNTTGATNDKISPPSILNLTINDIQVVLNENQEFTISGASNEVKISINTVNYRIFEYGEIEFKYPAGFHFSTDFAENGKTWRLTGDDFTLSYIKTDEPITIDEVINNLIEKVKKTKSDYRVKSNQRTINNTKLSGKSVYVDFNGKELIQEVYGLNGKKDTQFLMFLDFLDENGNPSREANEVIKLLNESLKKNKNAL